MPILDKITHAFHKDKATGSDSNKEAVGTAAEGTTVAETQTSGPVFDNKKITVIYVLGGPGAGMSILYSVTQCTTCTSSDCVFVSSQLGKGTQCALLVKEYDFVHLSGTGQSAPIVTTRYTPFPLP